MLKRTQIYLCIFLFQCIYTVSFSQKLLTPTKAFSHQKVSFVTKIDGTEIKGMLDDVDRKKGLIEEITIKDSTGAKFVLKAADVKFMYLYPSGLDNLGKTMKTVYDVQKWNDESLNNNLISQGYAYIEQSEVKLKKEKLTLLMELLNPSFSKYVKIYFDPLAKETASFGVGGLTVAGGDAKSYFFKKGNETAYKLEKWDYLDAFKTIWADCNKLIKKYPDPKWIDLSKHVFDYSSECK
jgi:hypothetical protein